MGHNAQAVTNEHEVVLAAEVLTIAPDFGQLEPMLDATRRVSLAVCFLAVSRTTRTLPETASSVEPPAGAGLLGGESGGRRGGERGDGCRGERGDEGPTETK